MNKTGNISGEKVVEIQQNEGSSKGITELLKDPDRPVQLYDIQHNEQQTITDHINTHKDSIDKSERHLIKHFSELPVFTSIEKYRVASYKIAGEAYLCLPQLLKSLEEDFRSDIISKILSITPKNSLPATRKQIEGFKKTSVLAPDADSCELIRRSDADRVCLRLFDLSNHNKSEAADLDSIATTIQSSSDTEDEDSCLSRSMGFVSHKCKSKITGENSLPGSNEPQSKSSENSISRDSGRGTSVDSQGSHNHVRSPQDRQSASPTLQKHKRKHDQAGSLESDESCMTKNYDQIGKIHKIRQRQRIKESEEKFPTELFESEVHLNILNLARDASSTLMIQVYHKCFGKCNGFFYPSLLRNPNSQCIECACCHTLISPRRFIGHTHGNKESNVCHWGFDSNNWRDYIHLSKKQSMNNLDDDELLIKFWSLKSIKDDDLTTSESSSGELNMAASNQSFKLLNKLPMTSEQTKVLNINDDPKPSECLSKDKKRLRLDPTIINEKNTRIDDQEAQRAKIFDHHRLNDLSNGCSVFPSTSAQALPINFSNNTKNQFVGQASASEVKNSNNDQLDALGSIFLTKKFDDHFANLEMIAASSLASTLAFSNLPSGSNTNGPQQHVNHIGNTNRPMINPQFQDTPASLYFKNVEPTDRKNLITNQLPEPAHCYSASLTQSIQQMEIENILLRELFFSNDLAHYLESKNVDKYLANDIIAYTLSLIKKSRMLFNVL